MRKCVRVKYMHTHLLYLATALPCYCSDHQGDAAPIVVVWGADEGV